MQICDCGQPVAWKGKCKKCYNRDQRQGKRLLAIEKLGGECVFCGESNPDLLHIDHVHGGGNAHRREKSHKGFLFRDADLKTLKPGVYRLLCVSCHITEDMPRILNGMSRGRPSVLVDQLMCIRRNPLVWTILKLDLSELVQLYFRTLPENVQLDAGITEERADKAEEIRHGEYEHIKALLKEPYTPFDLLKQLCELDDLV
jgi:hypothetical protein